MFDVARRCRHTMYAATSVCWMQLTSSWLQEHDKTWLQKQVTAITSFSYHCCINWLHSRYVNEMKGSFWACTRKEAIRLLFIWGFMFYEGEAKTRIHVFCKSKLLCNPRVLSQNTETELVTFFNLHCVCKKVIHTKINPPNITVRFISQRMMVTHW